jgi:type I restriction enzyme S subunit
MTKYPNGWRISTIGEVAEIVRGVTYSKADTLSENDNDAVPLLRATNLEVDSIDFEDMVYVPKRVVKAQQYLKLNDIFLAASSGSITVVGKSAQVVKTNGETFGAFCAVIRPKEIHPKFLSYWVQSPEIRDHWSATAKGTNINNLKPSDISETRVPIPHIGEQHKIVELLENHLSRLDAALADVKQAKVKAAQFRRSLLEEACTGRVKGDGTDVATELPIGWELKRLGDCLEKLDSGKLAERGWSPQCLSHPVQNHDTWGVLKTTAVQMGDYQPEYNKELPTSLAPKIGLEVNTGDFLVTTTGPRNRCGIVCHVKRTPRKLIFSGKILRFRANEDIVLANWLMFVLMSPEYQKTFDKLKVGTSDSSVSIGNQQIIDLNIPVPPIAAQHKIVEMLEDHLSRLDATLVMADAMEKQSSALRRSVLQAAFGGQLTKEVASV